MPLSFNVRSMSEALFTWTTRISQHFMGLALAGLLQITPTLLTSLPNLDDVLLLMSTLNYHTNTLEHVAIALSATTRYNDENLSYGIVPNREASSVTFWMSAPR
jgi:hypothetical protein